jgi:uncharacterized protein YcbX
MPMDRFRPNIVISGMEAYQEDQVKTLLIGGRVKMGIVKACTRCKITTIAQDLGKVQSKEPLKTLSEYRMSPEFGGVIFGQNAILLEGEGEEISIGDSVEIL